MKILSMLFWTLTLPLFFWSGIARADDTPKPVVEGYIDRQGHFSKTLNPQPAPNNGANNPQQTQPQQSQGPSQAELEAQRQQQLAMEKRKLEAEQAAAQAAFQADKQNAIKSLKGISSGDLQLKSVGSDNPSLALKGLDNSSAFSQLKSGIFDSPAKSDFPANELKDLKPAAAAPATPLPYLDASVVDARNVPSGLPKSVEDTIPHTPAGDRVRKGFQAASQRDWKVALAWFQDALNQQPGDPALQQLVNFAQFSLNQEIQAHTLPFENNSTPVQSALPSANVQAETDPDMEMNDYMKLSLRNWAEKNLQQSETAPSQPQKPEDPAWSKFTKWLNDTFGRKDEKIHPVGAVRG